MVISFSTCQKEEKNAQGLNIRFTLFCRDFKLVIIYTFFPPNLLFQKNIFFLVWPKSDGHTLKYHTGKRRLTWRNFMQNNVIF